MGTSQQRDRGRMEVLGKARPQRQHRCFSHLENEVMTPSLEAGLAAGPESEASTSSGHRLPGASGKTSGLRVSAAPLDRGLGPCPSQKQPPGAPASQQDYSSNSLVCPMGKLGPRWTISDLLRVPLQSHVGAQIPFSVQRSRIAPHQKPRWGEATGSSGDPVL